MKQVRFLDRREFTTEALMMALPGVAITIGVCGGGGPASPSPTGGGATTDDKTGGVAANQGHRATVTSAMLVAGNLVQLDIRGTADHTHESRSPPMPSRRSRRAGRWQRRPRAPALMRSR
jgi:hypothetical protein